MTPSLITWTINSIVVWERSESYSFTCSQKPLHDSWAKAWFFSRLLCFSGAFHVCIFPCFLWRYSFQSFSSSLSFFSLCSSPNSMICQTLLVLFVFSHVLSLGDKEVQPCDLSLYIFFLYWNLACHYVWKIKIRWACLLLPPFRLLVLPQK